MFRSTTLGHMRQKDLFYLIYRFRIIVFDKESILIHTESTVLLRAIIRDAIRETETKDANVISWLLEMEKESNYARRNPRNVRSNTSTNSFFFSKR